MDSFIKPSVISAAKLALVQVLQAWQRRAESPQPLGTRVAISIGFVTTYWSRGLDGTTRPFAETSVGGTRFLLVLDPLAQKLGVYEKFGRTWQRSVLLVRAAEILAALPRRALQAEPPNEPATAKQLETLKKFLRVPAAQTMPVISRAEASVLLDRLTVERALEELQADFTAWIATPAAAPNLAA